MDVGIYGLPCKSSCSKELTKDLETILMNMGGKKMFYAHSYYSKELLNEIYEIKTYDKLRKKYNCNELFLTFEEKVL